MGCSLKLRRIQGSNPLNSVLVNQEVKLKDVAHIQLGMAFKTAVKDLGDQGDTYLVSPGDIEPNGFIQESRLAQIDGSDAQSKYILWPGDVLLRLRGPSFSACIVREAFTKPAVTNNQTAVIKPSTEELDPYYLQWYLNSASCKRYFEACNEGSNIAKLNSKIVADIPLQLPSMAEQQRIGSIQKNWQAQRAGYKRLMDTGETYFNAICNDIQTGKVRG